MNIEIYAKENHYRTRNLHDGRPVPPAAIDRKKRTLKETVEETLRLGKDRCIAIVGEHGYVFEQDGKLEWFSVRKLGGSALMASVMTIIGFFYHAGYRSFGYNIIQEGDLEAAGTAPLAAIERVLEAIKVRRVGRGRPGSKGQSKEPMARIRKLCGQADSPTQST